MTTEYFKMSDERAEAIRVASGNSLTVAAIREFALADWPEGEAHQTWLDTATVGEIESWITDGLAGVSQDEPEVDERP